MTNKLITRPLLWLVMTIQRKPMHALGALVGLLFVPPLDLVIYSIVAPKGTPLLPISNDAWVKFVERNHLWISWGSALALMFSPFRFGRHAGWLIISWTIRDMFRK